MSVRVRFAPSPTGYLHIGNARSAIINALFAAQHKGWMLLRFDDTDLERSLPEYVRAIKEDLSWLGLHYDDSFHQADRMEYYKKAMQHLIQTGRLYPCYETPEELDIKRKRQLAAHRPPIYDRAALELTDQDRADLEAKGIRPHWRFKLEDTTMTWEDLVKGSLHYHAGSLSDPVLVRADGAFLYTFTSVVDDIDTKITHILRGEDHVTNTAVQLQVWQALTDVPTPKWGHMSLLLDVDGKPLSKRIGSLSLRHLRDQGVEPATLTSWIARLGTSHPFEAFRDVQDAAQHFDLSHFGLSSPRLDERDMWSINKKLLAHTPFENVKSRLPQGADAKLWELVSPHITTLAEFDSWHEWKPVELSEEDKAFVSEAIELLPEVWGETTWSAWTQALKNKTGRAGAALFKPLRLAVTGHAHGPEMALWLTYCGREEIVKRLVSC